MNCPPEEIIRKDLKKDSGEKWPYADRRQELVFIGHGLKHKTVQEMLDNCLLDDEEMQMGPEKWEEAWASEDQIQLSLDEDYYQPFAAALSKDEKENGEESEGEGAPPNKKSKRYRKLERYKYQA